MLWCFSDPATVVIVQLPYVLWDWAKGGREGRGEGEKGVKRERRAGRGKDGRGGEGDRARGEKGEGQEGGRKEAGRRRTRERSRLR